METSKNTLTVGLLDHLVDLTSVRDRDTLLSRLTLAIAETTEARLVETYCVVLDEGRSYWLPLTRAGKDCPVSLLADAWRTDPASMTAIDPESDRMRSLNSAEVRLSELPSSQGGHLSRFPVLLTSGGSPWGIVEITSDAPLGEMCVLGVTRLLNIYVNMLDMLDYSECDALTGLWNRKPFDDLFYKAIPSGQPLPKLSGASEHRESVPSGSFWLAMVDIDHFKQVNDTYGHLIGDEVLILVARILKSSFRAYDRVFRFGGEEFVVVLRCDGHEHAVQTLDRFRIRMEEFKFPQAGRITASIGVTEIVTGDSPSAACERADQAVYYAKQHGRNQVCSEADLVDRGLLNADVKVGDVELF